jgi:CYTH domain-containing protein/CHAD domain-containing protein
VRRRLRELGRATNAGRDAEVQLEWLGGAENGLGPRERTGHAWLVRRLRRRRRDGYREARKRIRRDFGRTASLVRERLEHGGHGGPAMRDAFTTLLREHAADLEARLGLVRHPDDQAEAHAARISAKRLRYLLEPFRAELEAAGTAVDHLKGLQDLLGELHDAHVLAGALAGDLEAASTEKARRLHALAMAGDEAGLARERRRDERLGLVSLATFARERIDRRYGALTRDWLNGGAGSFFTELATLAATVSAVGAVERERKYLLSAVPERAAAVPPLLIDQGWLPGERLRERLRRVRENGGDHYYRTVKLGTGERRLELEEETTSALFEALWPHTAGARVAKARHRVADAGLVWEIDVFADRDLVLAEVELPDETEAVTVPDWLAPHVVRDVTAEAEYVNLNLAR